MGEDAGAKSLAQALRSNSKLLTLRLERNFGMCASHGFLQGLAENCGLQVLVLDSSCLGDQGGVLLAGVLRTTKTLISLRDVSAEYNYIKAEGGRAIAEALRANTSLRRLGLSWNEVGDVGAEAFAGMLRTNRTLTCLELGRNGLTDGAAQKFAEALATNVSLTDINLNTNYITDTGADTVSRALNSTDRGCTVTVDFRGGSVTQGRRRSRSISRSRSFSLDAHNPTAAGPLAGLMGRFASDGGMSSSSTMDGTEKRPAPPPQSCPDSVCFDGRRGSQRASECSRGSDWDAIVGGWSSASAAPAVAAAPTAS